MCFTAGSRTSISNLDASLGDSSTQPALRSVVTASTPASNKDSALTSTECLIPRESVRLTRSACSSFDSATRGFMEIALLRGSFALAYNRLQEFRQNDHILAGSIRLTKETLGHISGVTQEANPARIIDRVEEEQLSPP
jgi:hypothetical protein